MGNRRIDDGYESDWAIGRTEVDGDGMFFLDASVDGQGGFIRSKPVFTADQAADYLNRGDGLFQGLKTGPIWRGAFDTIANPRHAEYGTAKPYDYVSGALTHLNFGFYNTTADIDPAYATIGSSTQPGKLRLDGFSAFSAAQREAARQAIEAWDELVNIEFVETSSATADINFMNTTTGPAQASAYLPWDYGSFYNGVAGDVAVNPSQASNQIFDEGQYGLTTLVHELGHSLGLSHPGDYNFGPGFDVNYDNGAEYYQDSYQYTIMSYWGGEETGMQQVDWKNLTYRYNSTPGVHDILAIQKMYGADYSTRNGNDTYGFNMSLSTTGRNDDNFDFVKTPSPVIAIWDGGGIDTLDLSGYNTPSIIDLNPGAFSSAGGTEEFLTLAQINANRAAEGAAPRSQATLDLYNDLFRNPYLLTDGLMKDNIGIAYGVIIENAIGGAGNDMIIGNDADNVLDGRGGNDIVSFQTAGAAVQVDLVLQTKTGGGGNDTIISFEGATGSKYNDTLLGTTGNNTLDGGDGDDIMTAGAGIDTASYASVSGGVTVSLALQGGAQNTGLKGGSDTLSGFENLTGSKFNDTLIGDDNANVIKGGDGVDKVTLGGGADTFVAELSSTKVNVKTGLMNIDIITDFNRADDLIDLSGVTGMTPFTFKGTMANKGAGDLSYKVYDSINGAENALGFDIDGVKGPGAAGQVTVVYADLNGGNPDLAIILLNTGLVDQSDFILS